ncbi:hypothetical protein TEQG_00211 [Trichophyton equinum CBS 127.97]|uniref:Uncharacterized protein n=1 Tax=Trichophyton equinum (strain ATCC MYA-4606 / CBS 127.97) TaxID=559882 RepID=F2PGZ1_TRIEC|nr:hypothetical protein TEQG_00211 [Trichophyton equinum CBS 127.97]
MACFCDKLRTERLSDITEAELFTENSPGAASDTAPAPKRSSSLTFAPTASRKRSRRLSDSSPSRCDESRMEHHPENVQIATAELPSADQDTALEPDHAAIIALENTYPHQELEDILTTNHRRIGEVPADLAAIVDIIYAIEQSDQAIEIKKLSKRIYYYALAKLHPKGTSVDDIVERTQCALKHVKNIRSKVYHYLRIGSRWIAIIHWFAFIVGGTSRQLSEDQLTGILCVLKFGSACEGVRPYSSVASGGKKIANLITMDRRVHTLSATPHWRASSSAAAYSALQGGSGSEDSMLILVLLCFLAPSEVTSHLLIRGASRRKRWSESGNIEEIDARHVGLVPELMHMLSKEMNLGLRTPKADGSYVLAPEISARVLEHLPPEQHSFWRLQALIVAFRSIPWKYLEPKLLDPKKLIVHLRHTLCGVQDNEGFQSLQPDMRMDLVFTLVEASRFPNTAWKWFVISQANEIMRGLNHPYLQSYISQRECLPYRITGDLDRANSAIYNPSTGSCQFPVEVKAHAGAGQVAIQRALNCIQAEELTKATDILEAWQPINQAPSPLEEVLLFREYVILGRISRFQGNFVESLESLERSKNLMCRYPDLDFSEDRVDLICNLGDTLIELCRPVDAEHYLRTEISCQDNNHTSAGSLLKLALAESYLLKTGTWKPSRFVPMFSLKGSF